MPRYCNFIIILTCIIIPSSCQTQEKELQGIKTPIWEERGIFKDEGAVFTYEVTVMINPPFYKGSIPLIYHAGKKFLGMNESVNLFYNFGEFRNSFIYTDIRNALFGIADGAITTDEMGRVLAEARLLKATADESKQINGVEIEEFHYNESGELIFKCKSFYSFPGGFKQNESEKLGKKLKEFYFLWPVSNF